jgi:hypothetical protein
LGIETMLRKIDPLIHHSTIPSFQIDSDTSKNAEHHYWPGL